jgi:hypothetical protein
MIIRSQRNCQGRHGEPDEVIIVLAAAGIIILVILFTVFLQKRLKR